MPQYNIATQIPGEIQWIFQAGGSLYPAATDPANPQLTLFQTAEIPIADIRAVQGEDKAAAAAHGNFNHAGLIAAGINQATFGQHLYGAWQHYRLSSELQTSIDNSVAVGTIVATESKAYLERFKRLVDTNKSRVTTQIRTHADLITPAIINTQKGYLEDVTGAPNNTKTKQALADQMVKLGLIAELPAAPGTGDPNHAEVLDFFAEREFYYLIRDTDDPAQKNIQKALLENKGFIINYLKIPGVGHDECVRFLGELRARGNAADNPNYQALKNQLTARLGAIPNAATHIENITAMVFAEGEYIHLDANRDRLGRVADGWQILHGMAIDRPTFLRSIATDQPLCTTRNQIEQIILKIQSGNETLDQLKVLMGKLGLGGSPINDNLAKQLFAEIQYRRLVTADAKLIPDPSELKAQLTGARAVHVKQKITDAVNAGADKPSDINKLVTDVLDAKSIDDLKGTPPGAPAIVGPLEKLGLMDRIDPADPATAVAADNIARPVFAENILRKLLANPPAAGALPLDSHIRRTLGGGPANAGGDNYGIRFKRGMIVNAQRVVAAPAVPPPGAAPPPPPFQCKTVDEALSLVKIDPSNPYFDILIRLTPAQLIEEPPFPALNPLNAIPGHPGFLTALGLRTGNALDDAKLARELYAEIQFERELKKIRDDAARDGKPVPAYYTVLKNKRAAFIAQVSNVANLADPRYTPYIDPPIPPPPAIPPIPPVPPAGSLRESFDKLWGGLQQPAAPGAAIALPDDKNILGAGPDGILAGMQDLGLAAIDGGGRGVLVADPALAAEDRHNSQTIFKEAQINRLAREFKQGQRDLLIAGFAGQADLTARAATGVISDSLDELLIQKKSTPGRNFMQMLDPHNSVALVDNHVRNPLLGLRDETKSTADIATTMYNFALIPAPDAKLDDVKKQFTAVQFRWLVEKAAEDQHFGRIATVGAPNLNLYAALTEPAVPATVPPTYPTQDAIKRFLSNFTTHAEVENFYKMLSTKKGDELRMYLLGVLTDGTPAERLSLTNKVIVAVTGQAYFAPVVENNKYLDLIENPFIREMLRKRGDVFGKNDAEIRRQINIFNETLREEKRARVAAGADITHAEINTALGVLFRELKNRARGDTVSYRGGTLNITLAAAVDNLITNAVADIDIPGPPPQFSLGGPRKLPSLVVEVPAPPGFTTLSATQHTINEFFEGFMSPLGIGGAAPPSPYSYVNSAERTSAHNILFRDILIKHGLRLGGAPAAAHWQALREFDWAGGTYENLIRLIQNILPAGAGYQPNDILTEQEFQRIKAYHRNRDMKNQDDAKQMMTAWKDISESGSRSKKTSYDRAQSLLTVIKAQIERIGKAQDIDGRAPDLKKCRDLNLTDEKAIREKSLSRLNDGRKPDGTVLPGLITIYELRLEEEQARHKLLFEDLKPALRGGGPGGLVDEARAIGILTAAPHRIAADDARKIYKIIQAGPNALQAMIDKTKETLESLKTSRDQLMRMDTQLTSIENIVKDMKSADEHVIEAVDSKQLELKTTTPDEQANEIDQYIAKRRGELKADPDATMGQTTALRRGVEEKKPVVSFTSNLTALVDRSYGDTKHQQQETRVYLDDSDDRRSSISKVMAKQLHTLAGADPNIQALVQALIGVPHTDPTARSKLASFFRKYESTLDKDLISNDLLFKFLQTACGEKVQDPALIGYLKDGGGIQYLTNQLYNACVSPKEGPHNTCIRTDENGVLRPSHEICIEAWEAVNHYFTTNPGATEFPIASAGNRVFGVALKEAFAIYELIHRKDNKDKGITLRCTDKSGLKYKAPSPKLLTIYTPQEYFRSYFYPLIKNSHDPRSEIKEAKMREAAIKEQKNVLKDVEEHMPKSPKP